MSDEWGEVIAEVGGYVDECGVCLAIYGEDLDPEEVSALLGRQPSHAHRRGDRQRASSRPFTSGAWLLERRGKPPNTADILTRTLLDSLPKDAHLWGRLRERFVIQVRYGIHMSGWNKMLDLSADVVALIGAIGAEVVFDIYAYGDDDAHGSEDSGVSIPEDDAKAT